MEINLTLVIIVTAAAIALLYYLIRQNQKDEKTVEKDIKAIPQTEDDDIAEESERL